MMSEKWSGDGTFYLPARQVEPYRLWFEFIKAAHRDSEINVDYDFYSDWGNFWEQSFSEWWSGANWRTLFAVDSTVRVLDGNDSIVNDDQAIVVRLPLSKDPRETMKDVQQLLDQHQAGTKLETIAQGKFRLSEGYEKAFLKYLENASFLQRLYCIWLDNADLDKKDRVKSSAVEFYTWAKQRDDMIRERNYKLARPMFPFAVRTFAEEILAGSNTTNSDEQRQFMRYLKKARNLANNAAVGVFPGKY
ncbi:hypothetical protein [Lentibacter algarum]|uniref:hypothetical protein n=1 Tax=Lentibacter algarum TaxID=576131 RepID=UPI00339D6708